LTPSEAERLLLEKAAPGEAWVLHSFRVRRVALAMGERLGGAVDLEFLAAAALLHDIGRSVTHGLWHPYEGWRLLSALGEPELARPAVTHWLKGRTLRRILRTSPGIDRGRIEEIFREGRPRPRTWHDLVVSAAAALAAPGGGGPVDERYRDLRQRYGDSPWLRDSRRITRGEFARLSRRAGVDLERLVLESAARP